MTKEKFEQQYPKLEIVGDSENVETVDGITVLFVKPKGSQSEPKAMWFQNDKSIMEQG